MKLHFQSSELRLGELGFERRLRQLARPKVLIIEQRMHRDDDERSDNQIDIESEAEISAVTIDKAGELSPQSGSDGPKDGQMNSLLRVAISDSGPGISSNANSLGKKGVGLSNVRSRLQQIYGPDFRFELVNAGAGGLTVVMEIPFQREANPGIEQRST